MSVNRMKTKNGLESLETRNFEMGISERGTFFEMMGNDSELIAKYWKQISIIQCSDVASLIKHGEN